MQRVKCCSAEDFLSTLLEDLEQLLSVKSAAKKNRAAVQKIVEEE